jgi:hypothetical protein
MSDVVTWHRDSQSGRIEAYRTLPSQKHSRDSPQLVEQQMIEQEEQLLRQRQKDIDRYSFHMPLNTSVHVYDYKSPFTNEYDQAIALQGNLSFANGHNEWNLKEFYRDVKTVFEHQTNTKPIFEKCLKLAR